jgi:hypothetical protein
VGTTVKVFVFVGDSVEVCVDDGVFVYVAELECVWVLVCVSVLEGVGVGDGDNVTVGENVGVKVGE